MKKAALLIDSLSDRLAPLRTRLGPLFWGAGVVFMIQRCADVANLVVKIILGRILPPVDFGALEPIYSALAILGLPSAIVFGASVKSVSRMLEKGHEAQCRRLVRHLTLFATGGSVLSVMAVVGVKRFILSRLHLDSDAYIWAIALMFAMAWWVPLVNSLLRAKRKYRYLILPSVVSPILFVLLTVALVSGFGLGLQGAILARGAGGVITVLLLSPFLTGWCRGRTAPYTEELKGLLGILGPMAILTLITTIGMHFDRLFVRNFMLEHSGGYGAVITLGQIPTLLIAPIIFVMLPLASAEHAGGRELGRFYRQSMLLAAAGTIGAAILFGLLARPAFSLWQPEFLPYAKYVWIYTLSAGILAMLTVAAQVEMARHAYGFLWFFAAPIVLFSGLLYGMQHQASLSFVLGGLVLSRAAALLLVMLHIRRRRY